MPRLLSIASVVSLLCLCWTGHASMHVPLTTERHVQLAQAICRGTVLRVESFKEVDGHIYTRTQVRVDEVFKGKFSPEVMLTHRGGTWGRLGESDDFAPQ